MYFFSSYGYAGLVKKLQLIGTACSPPQGATSRQSFPHSRSTRSLHDDQVLAEHVMHQPVQDVARQTPDYVRSTHKGRRLVLFRSPSAQPSQRTFTPRVRHLNVSAGLELSDRISTIAFKVFYAQDRHCGENALIARGGGILGEAPCFGAGGLN